MLIIVLQLIRFLTRIRSLNNIRCSTKCGCVDIRRCLVVIVSSKCKIPDHRTYMSTTTYCSRPSFAFTIPTSHLLLGVLYPYNNNYYKVFSIYAVTVFGHARDMAPHRTSRFCNPLPQGVHQSIF